MIDSMQYDDDIQMIAAKMSGCSVKRPSFMAEELRSEMHIAVLEMDEGLSKRAYLRRARDRAKNFIKKEARYARHHTSLEAMQEAGYQVDTENNIYAPEYKHR